MVLTRRSGQAPAQKGPKEGRNEALTTLNKHFGREKISAALGEILESLIATYVGGERRKRNTKGHDIFKGEHLIEVKTPNGSVIGAYRTRPPGSSG